LNIVFRDGALKIRVGDLLLFPAPEFGEQGFDVCGLAQDDEDVVVRGEERRGVEIGSLYASF
jgi:hypothetical protein